MIDLRDVQAELQHARETRFAVEKTECEIEALVIDMQHHAWQRVALADDNYDPHLVKTAEPSRH
jgi:hypothetical protein